MEEAFELYVQPHGFCLAGFDPSLVIASDLGNMLVFSAYVLGVPMCCANLWKYIPPDLKGIFWLGVGFVYLCGVSHFLDIVVTHRASWMLYQFVTLERVVTGVVSWAFVLAVFRAGKRYGLKVAADRPVSEE